MAAGIGLISAWVVPAGLPADEPAHWLNLLFYPAHHTMPVLGQIGTSYEAQQPPLAYTLGALVEWIVHSWFGLTAGFRAVRILDGLELIVAGRFAARLLGRLVDDQWAVATAVACLVGAPMFLDMAWSVQNDALVVALIFAVMDLVLSRCLDRITAVDGLLAGGLVGCGLLTKFTMWPLLVCVPLWLALRHGRAALRGIAAFLAGALAVSGWWFIRNLTLYGVVLPSSSLRGGRRYPPAGLHLHSVGHLVEELVTYMWLPTELWRNLISATALEKGLLLMLTLIIVVVPLARWWRASPREPREARRGVRLGRGMRERLASATGLVCLTGAVALVGYVGQAIWVTFAAPRLAYADLPLWLLAVAATVTAVPRRVRVGVCLGFGVLLIALNVLTLVSAAGTYSPYELIL